MSAIITVTCTACGTANHVPSAAMLAGVASEDLDLRLAWLVCWIRSGCGDMVAVPVAWRSFLTQLTAGVQLLIDEADDTECATTSTGTDATWAEPACRPHPELAVDGPAFTADDELNLHEMLTGDKWFKQVLAVDQPALRTGRRHPAGSQGGVRRGRRLPIEGRSSVKDFRSPTVLCEVVMDALLSALTERISLLELLVDRLRAENLRLRATARTGGPAAPPRGLMRR